MCLPQHPGSPENTVEKPHRSHLPISYVDRQEVSRIKIHVLDFPEGRDVVHMSSQPKPGILLHGCASMTYS